MKILKLLRDAACIEVIKKSKSVEAPVISGIFSVLYRAVKDLEKKEHDGAVFSDLNSGIPAHDSGMDEIIHWRSIKNDPPNYTEAKTLMLKMNYGAIINGYTWAPNHYNFADCVYWAESPVGPKIPEGV